VQQTLLKEIAVRQDEIAAAITIGNWLAVAGRVLEIIIGVILAYLLVRLHEIAHRSPLP
jgi:hypothetical protein